VILKFNKINFNDIVNTIGFYICMYDKEGIIRYYNLAFKNAYLHGSEAFVGKHFSSIENVEYQGVTGIKAVIETSEGQSYQKKIENLGLFYINTAPILHNGEINYIIETIATPFKAPILPVKEHVPEAPAQDMFLGDIKMQSILETISRISNFDSTILITGESGTGKSMLAKYIHSKSKRANKPFITINCAAIPENLIESELFGYVAGAFTGASQKGKKGLVEAADTGTLFLDEIGLLPLQLQSKFLQLIQEKTYTPIGALKSKTVDVRIISATNLNLKKQVMEHKFREDLFYRLRVIEFHMPPLRERVDAINPLIDYFLQLYNKTYHINKSITFETRKLLCSGGWSGNIRELQYVMERLVVTSRDDQITVGDIPSFHETDTVAENNEIKNIKFEDEVEAFEKELLFRYYSIYKSTYKLATAIGISQTKASRLLRKYNIQ